MDSYSNFDRSLTHANAVPQPSQNYFTWPTTFSYSAQDQGLANIQKTSAVNIAATETYAPSTTQPPQPMTGSNPSSGGSNGNLKQEAHREQPVNPITHREGHGDCAGSSPGNTTLIATPSSNYGGCVSSTHAALDTSTSKREKPKSYEELYPGFDPEEDVEVIPSWILDICKWGNCEGVRCRVDRMWLRHIFAPSTNEHGKSHRAEILPSENQLPGVQGTCLWDGCGRSMQLQSMKKHIEDAHLYLYRLKCIHCGTEKRRDSYRDSHGPASRCPKNPRFLQPTPAPCPPQRRKKASAQANSMPPPPVPNPKSLVPSSTRSVPLSARNVRYTPYPQSPITATAPTGSTRRALSDIQVPAQSRFHGTSSPATTPANTLDTYSPQLDMRMQSLWGSLYPGSLVPVAAGTHIQPPWRTPAAILALNPQRYEAILAPPAAPSAPQCIAPELLDPRQPTNTSIPRQPTNTAISHQPTNTSKVSWAVPTSQSKIKVGNSRTNMGVARHDGLGVRDAPKPARAIQRPAEASAAAPSFRSWGHVPQAPPTHPVAGYGTAVPASSGNDSFAISEGLWKIYDFGDVFKCAA
ncbi:hypothetical protein LXA43DRAFT_350309 [Ganoderma leucocontextum]|nr:hypothetical protein LXA43DRAFT_350309 [Ganoderma leucocontextum]